MKKSSYSLDVSALQTTLEKNAHTSFEVINILKKELSLLLNSDSLTYANDVVHNLGVFDSEILLPYINNYIIRHGIVVDQDFLIIKKLQHLRESIHFEKYRLERYLFTKRIDAVVRSKNIEKIECLLGDMETMYRENDSASLRTYILEQVERCIVRFPQEKQLLRKKKFLDEDILDSDSKENFLID